MKEHRQDGSALAVASGHRRWLVCVALTAALVGCSTEEDRTGLVVVVSSDISLAELAAVEATLEAPSPARKHRWGIVAADAEPPQSTTLPFGFGVSPPDGNHRSKIVLSVSALDAMGHVLVRQRVRVGFVSGERRRLEVRLTRSCRAMFEACERAAEPSTCVDGKCETIDVDVSMLEQVHEGNELEDLTAIGCFECAAGTDDAGADAMLDFDAAPVHDAEVDAGDAQMPSLVDASEGGEPEGGLADDAGDASDASATDGGMLDCGQQPGFFADVGRNVTRSGDGVSCAIIARNGFDDRTGDAADNLAEALADMALADGSSFDLFELNVVQKDATLYAAGYSAGTLPQADLPVLADVLAGAMEAGYSQPLKLNLTQSDASWSELGDELLALLTTSTGAGFATTCRPLYVIAENAAGLAELYDLQSRIAAEPTLAGRVHLGAYVPANTTASVARSQLDDMHAHQVELVELDSTSSDFVMLARYARSLGMHTFLRGVTAPGLVATLCGTLDAVVSNAHAISGGPKYRQFIQHSITGLVLDVTETPALASQISFLTSLNGTGEDVTNVTLGPGLPVLATGLPTEPLVDTFLRFTPSEMRSLALGNVDPASDATRFAVLALVRLPTTTLPMSERRVIVSKRQGQTGWALVLTHDMANTELLFEGFVRGPAPSFTVQSVTARFDVTALSSNDSYPLLFGIDNAPLIVTMGRFSTAGPLNTPGSTLVTNAQPLTVGVEPGMATDYFDGDLQLLKVISYY